MAGKFLNVEEIAAELDVKEDTVRDWIRSKQLPAYKIGREYKIDPSDYKAFLAKRRTVEEKEEKTQ